MHAFRPRPGFSLRESVLGRVVTVSTARLFKDGLDLGSREERERWPSSFTLRCLPFNLELLTEDEDLRKGTRDFHTAGFMSLPLTVDISTHGRWPVLSQSMRKFAMRRATSTEPLCIMLPAKASRSAPAGVSYFSTSTPCSSIFPTAVMPWAVPRATSRDTSREDLVKQGAIPIPCGARPPA